jgi:hypothetical protein
MGEATGKITSARTAIAAQLKGRDSLTLLFMATALSLISIFLLPEWKVPVAWAVTIGVLCLSALWLALSALRNALADAQTRLPAVLQALELPGDEGALTLLLEPNELFGVFTLVSIFYASEDGFEMLVGHGEVKNVQKNGKIQIGVESWEEPYASLRNSVKEQNTKELARLLVRPSVARNQKTKVAENVLSGEFLRYLIAANAGNTDGRT